jgi:secreted trypsin-like serine protease
MRLRLGLIFAIAAIAVGATAASAFALIHGSPDGNRHPYVGLVAEQGGGLCSGSLIGPSVFLTAGHCFADGALVFVSTAPAFDPSALVPGIVHVQPGFAARAKGGLPGTLVNDVAVVTLLGSLPGPYAQLPPYVGYDSTLPNNQRIDNLGYGYQTSSGADYFPVRTLGGGKIVPGGGSTAASFLKISSSAGQGSATCFGDSGGPNLEAGTNRILAINSYGASASCAAVSYSQRLDTGSALGFVSGFLR